MNKYNGFTEPQLRAAFEKVEDKTNWKNPIKAYIKPEEIEITKAAIEFFTATQATFKNIDINKVWVEAPGYYNGPAN
jgi:hypothetical protein